MLTKESLKGNQQKKIGERQIMKGKIVYSSKNKLINGIFFM